MLLVVAPTVRLATLWVELLRAVPELAPTAPSPSAVSATGVLSVKAAGSYNARSGQLAQPGIPRA